jgi:hypothetical protein
MRRGEQLLMLESLTAHLARLRTYPTLCKPCPALHLHAPLLSKRAVYPQADRQLLYADPYACPRPVLASTHDGPKPS